MLPDNYIGINVMSIDNIGTSTVMKHPVLSPVGDVVVHENKISHMHIAQSNRPVPPVDSADFLQPLYKRGDKINILI